MPTVSAAWGIDKFNFTQAGAGAVKRLGAAKFDECISVKDFGALGDGINDDGPAFNAAIAAHRSVGVPPGDYLIKTQIVINLATSLYGTGGVTPFTVTSPGPRLIYHSDLGSSPMVLCKEASIISNLGFLGPAKGGSTLAIRNKKDSSALMSYEDMDVTLNGNYFINWGTAVEHYNRGLNLADNNIALVAYGVNLFWDDSAFVDDPANVFDAKEQGFRAIRVEGNRFHATNIAINNTGTDARYLRGLKVLGNHIDIGDQLFNGGLYSGIFDGNTIDQTNASLGAIQITTATQEVTITGNQITGDLIQGIPTQLIGFSSTAQEVTITGNTLKHASSYGISFGGAVSGATISGNSISEVGTPGNTTRACIRFIGSATNVAIIGNYFNPTTDAYCIRGSTGFAWTGVTIQGNSWNTSRLLSGVYTDSGNNSIQTSGVPFTPSGVGAVTRHTQDKLRESISVKDFGAHSITEVGYESFDSTSAIQAALDTGRLITLPPGIYKTTQPLVIQDNGGLIGSCAFWKRRTGYIYDGTVNTVIKYAGAAGANTCVIRASNVAVGAMGGDFSGSGTDDLINATLANFHVDANGLADFGVYVYRAGNQSTLYNVTVEKAVVANHVHLGCYAAKFGVFGSYEAVGTGVICGWDIFNWNSVEATNFSYSATFLTVNNGTGHTYVRDSATDQDNSGGKFSVGRGSKVYISSEGNYGRACILSTRNTTTSTIGPIDYNLEYLEGNADGPYVDYRPGCMGMRLVNGFIHPGNLTTLASQDIKIESKNNSGVVTADTGPADNGQWLVLERLYGEVSGVGFAINSNTDKFIVRDCARTITYTSKSPQIDGFVSSKNLISGAVYFTAAATPAIWSQTGGTLARSAAGVYIFTIDIPYKISGQCVPVVSVVISAALDTKVRLTSISSTSITIRTYDGSGAQVDTGDRISMMVSGLTSYGL